MCEVAFQGGAGKQTNSIRAGSAPGETPTRSCQRQTASLQKRNVPECTGRRRKRRLMNGEGEERRKTPIHFKVRPLAGVPYKLYALNIILKVGIQQITSDDATITKVSGLKESTVIFVLV